MELNQAADRFAQVTQEIHSLLGVIRSEVAGTGSHFQGEAAGTFRTVMTRYDGDANTLKGALSAISEAIAVSGKTYHASDASSSSALQSAGSGLNLS